MEKESKHLLEEQELVVGQAPHWTQHVLKAFPAFRHYNYRLFFAGQGTSLIGTWIQTVALGWLVLELTNSAFWVSFVSALNDLPILVFSLPAGILADRFEKKLLIIVTQILAMVVAFSFAGLTALHFESMLLIIILTFIMGVSHAVEMPVRQTFIFDVVGRKDIASAVALNVGMFNSARVVGPAMAGGIIALFSFPIAFFLNGVSFLAVLFALAKIQIKRFTAEKSHPHPLTQLKEGVHFAMRHPVISTLLLVLAFNSSIPWAHSSIMPVIAKQIYHVGSGGFGILLSASGLGALVAAIFVSSFGERLHVGKTIGSMLVVCAVSLLLFANTQNFFIGYLLLFIIGVCLLTQVSMINATIQRASPDYIRGRVMSVYALMFLGIMPLGGILMGTFASLVGVQPALFLFGLLTLLGAFFYLFFLQNRLKEA